MPYNRSNLKKEVMRMKKIILIVVGIIVVLGIIGAVIGGSGNSNSSSSNNSNSNESKSTTAGIGQAAKDGKFEFTVNSFKCGQSSVGKDFLTKTAQGQYCLIVATKSFLLTIPLLFMLPHRVTVGIAKLILEIVSLVTLSLMLQKTLILSRLSFTIVRSLVVSK